MLTAGMHQHKLKQWLTIASEALIGMPTMVTDVPMVEMPLAKATELAPVDACSNLL